MIISTPRTKLRCWRDSDRDALAAMLADPEVMLDCGGPLGRAEGDAKLDRYAETFDRCGFCRWVIEASDGEFLGYAGIMPLNAGRPIGPHADIGWRLVRRAWGQGCATEAAQAARAALQDGFLRGGLGEVFSYTAPDNLRSQAVMARLGLQRESSRDFTMMDRRIGPWRGLVWVARPGEAVINPRTS